MAMTAPSMRSTSRRPVAAGKAAARRRLRDGAAGFDRKAHPDGLVLGSQDGEALQGELVGHDLGLPYDVSVFDHVEKVDIATGHAVRRDVGSRPRHVGSHAPRRGRGRRSPRDEGPSARRSRAFPPEGSAHPGTGASTLSGPRLPSRCRGQRNARARVGDLCESGPPFQANQLGHPHARCRSRPSSSSTNVAPNSWHHLRTAEHPLREGACLLVDEDELCSVGLPPARPQGERQPLRLEAVRGGIDAVEHLGLVDPVGPGGDPHEASVGRRRTHHLGEQPPHTPPRRRAGTSSACSIPSARPAPRMAVSSPPSVASHEQGRTESDRDHCGSRHGGENHDPHDESDHHGSQDDEDDHGDHGLDQVPMPVAAAGRMPPTVRTGFHYAGRHIHDHEPVAGAEPRRLPREFPRGPGLSVPFHATVITIRGSS